MFSTVRDRVNETFQRPWPRAGMTAALAALVARSRANIERSRWLHERARRAVARSARLCPTPIAGGSDANAFETIAPMPVSNGGSHPAVSVLVLAPESAMRARIGDAVRDRYEIVEASDVPAALKLLERGERVDVVVLGAGMNGESDASRHCALAARKLYAGCPWLPVIVVGGTPSPRLKADVLLTGVRAFLPNDFTAADLAAALIRFGRRPVPIPTSARVAVVKQIFAVLEQAITDVPALATLAQMVGMSRSHFSRTFHAAAGISLRDYVRDLRLKRAQELMRVSQLSLSAIAAEAGFYDLPHFNKAFRHRFGMSPTQFRLASLSSPAT